MVVLFTVLLLLLPLNVAWPGDSGHATPDGFEIRWQGSPPGCPEKLRAWQYMVRLFAEQDNPDRDNHGYWCAVDFAVGDSLKVAVDKGATARVHYQGTLYETIEIFFPTRNYRDIKVYASAEETFAVSHRSIRLRDDKWVRGYLVFDTPVDEIDVELKTELPSGRLYSEAQIYFDGLTIERISN